MKEVILWGDQLEDIANIKSYKGKFVLRKDGTFLAKLFPKEKWDGSKFFHNMLLEEQGIKDAESPEIKKTVLGGGKIEVELMGDYLECRLYGKSSIYGRYEKDDIDIGRLQSAVENTFALDVPVLVIPDFEDNA